MAGDDDVIVPTYTFTATAEVVTYLGARPVLADVDPVTGNLRAEDVAAVLTPKTRAVVPVHLGGLPCEMAPLRELADGAGIRILEDAAHAFPARERRTPVGMLGDAAAFSFYATKNMTTAEGGMLTGDPALLERSRVISLHGMSRDAWRRYDQGGSWFYEVLLPGFKYNMSDVQAALGLWQLRKLPRFQDHRRHVVRLYQQAFADEPALELPVERPDVEHAWHLYTLRIRPEALRVDRDHFLRELSARNIGTSVHFIPIHLHPYYKNKYGHAPGDFPVAYNNYRRLLSLPLHPRLTDRDVADVVEAVLDVVRAFRR